MTLQPESLPIASFRCQACYYQYIMGKIHIKNWRTGTFAKAQYSSLISTTVDFSFTFIFTRLLGIWYLFSSITGTILGGIVNFLLGRNWVFKNQHTSKLVQAKRYLLIWSGSLSLNSLGLYLLTELFRWHYLLSKSVITIIVGIFFNFLFQKSYVFRT